MKYFLLLIVLLPFVGFSQNTGLYGKKTILEVQAMGSMPLVSNWFNGNGTYYKAKGTSLVDSRNLLDYGVRVNLARAFSNQVGMGIEFGLERQVLSAPEYVDLVYDNSFGPGSYNYPLRHEKLRLQTMTIMPKLEFSSRGNLLPIGLSHQIGVGYTRASIVERDYLFFVENNFNDSIITPIENGLVDYEKFYTGFTVMYQINMRTPVTEQIVVTYGLRYNMNFVRNQKPTTGSAPGELYLINDVRRRRNQSFVQLNIGVGYVF